MKINSSVLTLCYIYIGRVYSAIIAVLLIPYFIKLLGREAYGLIGYFIVLQACLSIFDVGIGGVLTRQAIRSVNSKKNFDAFIKLFYKAVLFFISISGLIFIAGYLSSDIFVDFLNTKIPSSIISESIFLMLSIFSVRYIQGPFRSILLAAEKQILLTSLNVLYVTISQIFVYILLFEHNNIIYYFKLQLLASIINTVLIIFFGFIVLYSMQKESGKACANDEHVSTGSFRSMLFFATQLSVLSILWVMVNQSDKVVLAKYLPLNEYASYSIAISFVGMLSVFGDPLNQYLQPKLTSLFYKKKYLEYTSIFNKCLDFSFLITIPLSLFLVFFSDKLIYIWTQNYSLAYQISKYLPWLFIGGVFSFYSNFVFLLLYSVGRLKYHTIVYSLFSIIIVPLNIYFAKTYLGEGTSLFYLINTIVLFLVWGGYIFSKYFYNGFYSIMLKILPLALINYLFYFLVDKINFGSILYKPFVLFSILLLIGTVAVGITLVYLLVINKLIKCGGIRVEQ
ncbi:oligosaccharide flippase family protein [Kluyvera ascorbata]|nr:oligosaccharide flippase family protein [Kluyvera ascorbata]